MKKLFGNTIGLKPDQHRRIEKLYRRRIPPEMIITAELARELSRLSKEIRRQIGLLINRRGRIACVIVGDRQRIVIPDLSEYRSAPGRLRGLRCIHTHLDGSALTADDLTDLALLRLDLMAAVTLTADGFPLEIHAAHLLPQAPDGPAHQKLPPLRPGQLDIGCLGLIQALEAEMAHLRIQRDGSGGTERAILVSVTTEARKEAQESMTELRELARSGGIHVIGSVVQKRRDLDARHLLGKGKLNELTVMALQKGGTVLIFDQELSPSQIRSVTDQTDLKVIDRTQLILDIFAQRAQTREGKRQVELAQLKYLLPRLVHKNTAMSRLTGGIGGRGPGETKLEINRRRVRERIVHLENDLATIRKNRQQQRALRHRRGLPVVSIVGYTNAGKSTLLNTLSKSSIHAENRLFSTLDPASRRIKFPRDMEVVVTDTVGFIRDLPQDLVVAFRATLEELDSADLLLHVIDIHDAQHAEQIAAVEGILAELDIDRIPLIRVLNKMDLLGAEDVAALAKRYGGIPICAKDENTLSPLISRISALLGDSGKPGVGQPFRRH